MNLAVMQPYLFPYIGYFQLICATDLFLIFDDVAYIKKGYINRNSILVDGQPFRFTVPVPGASQNKKISELGYSTDIHKILSSISHAYSKAPYYGKVFPLIRDILLYEKRGISDLCMVSYQSIFSYLGMNKSFIKTSDLSYPRDFPAQDRIIHLCKRFNADRYINAIGGVSLYSRERFLENDMELCFLKPEIQKYNQGISGFIPGLSIIDCLMHCSPDEIKYMLFNCELV